MIDWMNTSDETISNTVVEVLTRLALAWIAGWVISLLARSGRGRGQVDAFPATLVLLSVLIAMVTQIVGNNVARAFSLVGALSIVRFRTAVPTTRDIAYVLASVVVGMSIGAGQFAVSALGLMSVIAVSTLHFRQFTQPSRASTYGVLTMQLTLGSNDIMAELLRRLCDRIQLMAISTARKGAAMSYTYEVTLRPETLPNDLVTELNCLDTVESISWEVLP